MRSKIFGPHKKRTRQHVIADLAVHHVEGFILESGHTAERFWRDYGYDLLMTTFDRDGYIEPGAVRFQIKATEKLSEAAGAVAHDIDIRDYNIWIREQMPVILVLFDARRRIAYWLDLKRYFLADESLRPKKKARWVRVWIPIHQVLSNTAIADLRALKNMGLQV